MKIIKNIVLIVFSLLLCRSNLAVAEPNYNSYVSPEFMKAIEILTPETFFSADVRQSEAFKNFGTLNKGWRLDTEKSYQSNLFNAKYHIDAQHYQEIADKYCAALSEAYADALDSAEGDVSPYLFTDQITNAFEAAGAYALPIQIVSRNFDAKYILEKELNSSQDVNKRINILKFLDDHFHGTYADKYLSANGNIEIKNVYERKKRQGGPIKINVNALHQALTNKWQYNSEKFQLSYELIQPYVFIFHQDPKDINKEHIFLYVDVPYGIDIKNYGKTARLKVTDANLKCYANSSVAAKVSGITSPVFKSGEKSIALLENFRPLMAIPDSNYLKYGDKIQINDISNPSLECLLIFENAQDGDLEKCKTKKYQESYIKLMNERICVAKANNLKPSLVNENFQFFSGFNENSGYSYEFFSYYDKNCSPVAKKED